MFQYYGRLVQNYDCFYHGLLAIWLKTTGNQFIVKSDDFVLFLFYLKMKDYQTLYGHIWYWDVTLLMDVIV